jgi:guanine nucleotide-binding protein G(I)/G(S)/G(T) subunit beta-1
MASLASKNDLLEKIQDAKRNIESLKTQIEVVRSEKSSETLASACKRSDAFDSTTLNPMVSRRLLRGHFGKVYSLSWSGDSVHLVSASQDGKLIIWNGVSANKVQSIPLASSWVITCAYEQSANRLVASGGMDNTCSVYRVDKGGGNSTARMAQVRRRGAAAEINVLQFFPTF